MLARPPVSCVWRGSTPKVVSQTPASLVLQGVLETLPQRALRAKSSAARTCVHQARSRRRPLPQTLQRARCANRASSRATQAHLAARGSALRDGIPTPGARRVPATASTARLASTTTMAGRERRASSARRAGTGMRLALWSAVVSAHLQHLPLVVTEPNVITGFSLQELATRAPSLLAARQRRAPACCALPANTTTIAAQVRRALRARLALTLTMWVGR